MNGDAASRVGIGRRMGCGRVAGADKGNEVSWILEGFIDADGMGLKMTAARFENVVLKFPTTNSEYFLRHGLRVKREAREGFAFDTKSVREVSMRDKRGFG